MAPSRVDDKIKVFAIDGCATVTVVVDVLDFVSQFQDSSELFLEIGASPSQQQDSLRDTHDAINVGPSYFQRCLLGEMYTVGGHDGAVGVVVKQRVLDGNSVHVAGHAAT